MKKTILTFILLLSCSTFIFGQNRMRFKHKLSQNIITQAGFALRDGAGGILNIAPNAKLKCIIKLDSRGTIFVDFWQINPATDPYAGVVGIVNSNNPFSILTLPTLIDGRVQIGDPTRYLKVPFNCFTFGVATLPFRYRGSESINSTEKVSSTITSPKPDISFTGGWTFGKSYISNRSIVNLSATFGAFLGLTSTEIKDGVVNSTSVIYGTKKIQTNPAIQYGPAITLARNNLGVVIAVGFDSNIGSYSNDWIYQTRPWLGIGLSANLGLF